MPTYQVPASSHETLTVATPMRRTRTLPSSTTSQFRCGGVRWLDSLPGGTAGQSAPLCVLIAYSGMQAFCQDRARPRRGRPSKPVAVTMKNSMPIGIAVVRAPCRADYVGVPPDVGMTPSCWRKPRRSLFDHFSASLPFSMR